MKSYLNYSKDLKVKLITYILNKSLRLLGTIIARID